MTISRRDFLKLSGSTLLGLLFSGSRFAEAFAAVPGPEPVADFLALPTQGRVLYSRLKVHLTPEFAGEQTGSLLFDNLVDIAERLRGGAYEDANHTWYRLAAGGYVHSGGIQLVETVTNPTLLDIAGKCHGGRDHRPVCGYDVGNQPQPGAGSAPVLPDDPLGGRGGDR